MAVSFLLLFVVVVIHTSFFCLSVFVVVRLFFACSPSRRYTFSFFSCALYYRTHFFSFPYFSLLLFSTRFFHARSARETNIVIILCVESNVAHTDNDIETLECCVTCTRGC